MVRPPPTMADRLSEKDETIRQLRETIAPKVQVRGWSIGLTRSEAAIVICLEDGLIHSSEQLRDLLDIVNNRIDGMEVRSTITAHMTKLRQKFPPEVTIINHWGRGYQMPRSSISALRALEIPRR